ncbi:MAG: hypothetical protein OEZ48_12120 [Candidatus Bathyarchaeota archaeon]|nr:hypothetical protein [Candidatus Bathyarchaeota archaeon]MDH5688591.1 hypothetical protein [Candidatus Bathyarchaeota archaeon]
MNVIKAVQKMAEITIEVSDLRKEGAGKVKDLAEFIETSMKVELIVETKTISLKDGGPSKRYLRVLIRKFLHRSKLKGRYRLISGGENTMIVKRRRKE